MYNLDKAAAEINAAHDQFEMGVRTAAKQAVRIGKLLIEARGWIKDGRWMEWIEKNLHFSYRQAAKYVRLATHLPPGATGTINELLSLLAVDPDDEDADSDAEGGSDLLSLVDGEEVETLDEDESRRGRELTETEARKFQRKMLTLANIAKWLRRLGRVHQAELIEEAVRENAGVAEPAASA